jgi:hypothetical protein
MHRQTKDAIVKLRAAGLSRSWFSVTTERLPSGYGEAQITILKPIGYVLPYLSEILAQGLKVRLFCWEQKVIGIGVYPKWAIWDRHPRSLWCWQMCSVDVRMYQQGIRSGILA